MRSGVDARRAEQRETQLAAIRELMVAAAARGAWLTLDEIARYTEFGAASISAQLRHLRKKRHGQYRVEKRRRRQVHHAPVAGPLLRQAPVWEYCVYESGSVTQESREVTVASCESAAPVSGRDTCPSV